MKKMILILLAVIILSGISVLAVFATDLTAPADQTPALNLTENDFGGQDGDIAVPYAYDHCTEGTETGRYTETLISHEKTGYQTGPCVNGVIGGTDYREEYTDRYFGSCTLCDYTYTHSVVWWTGWKCLK